MSQVMETCDTRKRFPSLPVDREWRDRIKKRQLLIKMDSTVHRFDGDKIALGKLCFLFARIFHG